MLNAVLAAGRGCHAVHPFPFSACTGKFLKLQINFWDHRRMSCFICLYYLLIPLLVLIYHTLSCIFSLHLLILGSCCKLRCHDFILFAFMVKCLRPFLNQLYSFVRHGLQDWLCVIEHSIARAVWLHGASLLLRWHFHSSTTYCSNCVLFYIFFPWKWYNICRLYLYMNYYLIAFNEHFTFKKVICCFTTHSLLLSKNWGM